MVKGDIYLAEFGKSRDSFAFGKKRPVLIFQTDKLNYAVREGIYDHFLVIPLSTQSDIVTEEFRYPITARGKLENDSLAVCNSLCFLHKHYLVEKLGALSDAEIEEIHLIMRNLFDL